MSIDTPSRTSIIAASPALSISSIIRPTNSTFLGQSPSLGHQSFPSLFSDSTMEILISGLQGDFEGTPNPIVETSTLFPLGFTHLYNSRNGPETETKTAQDLSVPTRKRYRQADEESLREELSRLGMSQGDQHLDTSKQLCALSRVLTEQGRYKTAEETARQAIMACETANPDENIRTHEVYGLLGEILTFQGFYEKAERIHVKVLRHREAILGPEHPDTLTSIRNLAATYQKQGRWMEAEGLEVQAMK